MGRGIVRGISCLALVLAFGDTMALDWKAAGNGGAVAAGADGSAEAGLKMLEADGNAADAAAATILALAVTDYEIGASFKFCIGSEVPVLIYLAETKEVVSLSGQGAAPLDQAAIDWYMQNGIPWGIKAASVPAVVHLCGTLIKEYGTKTFEEVAGPTLEMLDAGGRSWSGDLAATFRKLIEGEKNNGASREENIQAAIDRFYKGDVADALDSWYRSVGHFLRKADLEAHQTYIEEPVSVEYRGYTVYKCPTWTQGPYECQALRLLEGFDLRAMGHLSADYIHAVTEAMKLALADRDTYYGDPRFVDVPMEALLSDRYTELRRALIDMSAASWDIRPGDPYGMNALRKGGGEFMPGPGGTTTCATVDTWGNMVAATPSGWGNDGAGSAGSTGVVHGTRLVSLNTNANHPNRIEAGKRPRITLTPTLVCKDGKAVLAVAIEGGDLQGQTSLNLILHFIEGGMMPEDAIVAPRFATGQLQDSFNPNPNRSQTYQNIGQLEVHTGVGQSVLNELRSRGHDVKETSGQLANPVMIYRDPETGISYAAGNPYGLRHAGALGDMTGAVRAQGRRHADKSALEVKSGTHIVSIAYTVEERDREATVSVFNPSGQTLWRRAVDAAPGTHRVEYHVKGVDGLGPSPGCYVVELRTAARTVIQRLNMPF